MSIIRVVLALALAGGCTKVPTNESPSNDRDPGVAPIKATATVTLVSVSFGNDCGGTPPSEPPAGAVPAPNRRAPGAAPSAQHMTQPGDSPASYRCEQTSMQLSIAANKDAAVKIKTVDVLDETGASLGVLSTSKPTRWSATSSAYEAWDEKVAAGQTALVSYVLSQPGFIDRYDNRDHMYTVKVTASVGGIEQALQTTVMVVAQPAPVPT